MPIIYSDLDIYMPGISPGWWHSYGIYRFFYLAMEAKGDPSFRNALKTRQARRVNKLVPLLLMPLSILHEAITHTGSGIETDVAEGMRKPKRLGISCSRANLAGGGKIKMFVIRELLIGWPHEGLERDTLISLNILNEALCKNRN